MLKTGHRLAGVLCGANLWCAAHAFADADPVITGLAAALAVAVSTWNDWDLNYYKDSWNPAIGLVRWSAKVGYAFHTDLDRERWDRRAKRYAATWEPGDLHRGPTHCIEWCMVFGAVFGVLGQVLLGPFGVAGWWLGLGAFVGAASHVCADAITPSGVPFSAIYNWARYGEVWRRHAVGWRVPFEPQPDPKTKRMRYAWTVHVGPVEYQLGYLTWIRYPSIVLADERAPGCRPGICRSDRAGDHLFGLYAMVPSTAVTLMLWLGVFGPVAHVFTLGLWPAAWLG